MPKVSVALCTYNGATYIEQQLESIAQQSYPIDEIVVCDDRSTDNTITLIEDFAKNQPFKVSVFINEQNVGSTKNFENAIKLCSHEIIFLSDQDDAWHPDKVKKMVAYFENYPAKSAVFSDANIIDDSGNKTGKTLWQLLQFTPNQQQKFISKECYKLLLQSFIVTGATLAIKKSAIELLMPFPEIQKKLIHDGWIALALCFQNKIGLIEECLTDYRIHQQQQVGIGKAQRWVTLRDRFTRPRNEKIKPIVEKYQYFEELYGLLANQPFMNAEQLAYLHTITNHYRVRATLPTNRFERVKPIWEEWKQNNYRFSSPMWWRPLLGDLFE